MIFCNQNHKFCEILTILNGKNGQKSITQWGLVKDINNLSTFMDDHLMELIDQGKMIVDHRLLSLILE